MRKCNEAGKIVEDNFTTWKKLELVNLMNADYDAIIALLRHQYKIAPLWKWKESMSTYIISFSSGRNHVISIYICKIKLTLSEYNRMVSDKASESEASLCLATKTKQNTKKTLLRNVLKRSYIRVKRHSTLVVKLIFK